MRRIYFLVLAVLVSASVSPLIAQSSQPITITVDATDAPRKMLHADMAIPVHPGDLTLLYAQWIPGEHGPTGPIDNLAGLTIQADGKTLPWVRDSVNMFAFHVHVPDGVTLLKVHDDFLATAGAAGFSAGASTSANLAMVSWNEVILWPANRPAHETMVQPNVILPDGWKFGTALTSIGHEGNTTHFAAVSVNDLVDSPLLSGRYFKEYDLAPEITPKHYLDLVADGPEDLAVPPQMLAGFNNLVRETGALYTARHYNSYHFLMTLSDQVAHFGLEHHQSNDDRVPEKTFLSPNLDVLEAGLLPHEFTHSWNGKYRRPGGLISPDFQTPMKGNLLWVYEGLTEYLGDVLTARSCGESFSKASIRWRVRSRCNGGMSSICCKRLRSLCWRCGGRRLKPGSLRRARCCCCGDMFWCCCNH